MPRLKKKTKNRQTRLTETDVRFMLTGQAYFTSHEPTDVGAWKQVWEANREWLLSAFIEINPGRRPASWWRFDAPESRKQNRTYSEIGEPIDLHADFETQFEFLESRGLLRAGESKPKHTGDRSEQLAADQVHIQPVDQITKTFPAI